VLVTEQKIIIPDYFTYCISGFSWTMVKACHSTQTYHEVGAESRGSCNKDSRTAERGVGNVTPAVRLFYFQR